jgi:hypothetical protein
VVFNDATGSTAELAAVLGGNLVDVTPAGTLAREHPVLQVVPARDVTRHRKPSEVVPVLRGVLHDLRRQGYRRVGLLTHTQLSKALPGMIEEPYKSTLSTVGYFRSGLSRGSNRWHRDCDALVVLGTPRVPPAAVRDRLIRLRKLHAARRTADEAGWCWDAWSGVTESGRRVTVRTKHYRDHDWHAAYWSVVVAELVQSVGRGRGILPEGIPVFVVTTENLAPPDADDGANGIPLAEHPYAPLTEAQAKVLASLYRQAGRGTRRVRRTSSQVAAACGFSRKTAHEHLTALAAAGRVRRLGQGVGWLANA